MSHANAAVRIAADAAAGGESFARHLIRAPFSMNKIRCEPAAATLIHKTKTPTFDDTAPARVARANWARFSKKVFAVDPLVCPDCGGAMRSIAFIEEPRVARAIIEQLSLWDAPTLRLPPVAAVGTADFKYVP